MNVLTLNINIDDLRELMSSSMGFPQLLNNPEVFYRNLSNTITIDVVSQR